MAPYNLHTLVPITYTSPSTWIESTAPTFTYSNAYQSMYLVDCLHCGGKFVTTPRRTMACIQSLETCWDVTCPSCSQELRLCLHECRHDCDHALDCLTLGILEKVIEKGLKLEFESGARVHQVSPFQRNIVGAPWITTTDDVVYGTWDGSTSYGGTTAIGNLTVGAADTTIAVSFCDRLKERLASLQNEESNE